ncbi:rab11 family-interacting protein 1 isoform X1 [Solea solea]|uniref:rab11 family-interacting protein 1 isoform X1 n=1 Tax=Solea solea TaxID=90069 RepID=UPI00272CFA58|nr:rab11 family-interacting protein 1 isoform X1 [Solea solea]
MSLVDQSQQWFPTSVHVTVHQGRNLRAKGKNGTSDSYAIIQVAKDKFSTTVAEKSVDPVWKEEASFELPLFHPGNAERCTLYIIVMHRAQVGLDKFLGQAVVNLVDLHEDKDRKKTNWFKLVDKSGKEDKARGEVLLDIQFMRNNMSASMFDLSMQDKPRSRISKLKDKVRGKKKDSFSDSASAIVPSVSQVLTDSEGEPDTQSLSQSPGTKKRSKFKKLFVPKSNLQRNTSQSMSTLGTLPEKNSSLSGSRSSGLNVDSPEVKKKFKFLGHKRTGSSDSKVSQGPFSLLGRSKQSNNDQNSLCINGSHVYAEENEPKSGSMLSLNSSGQGSVEEIRISVPDPTLRQESSNRAVMEQHRHQEEEQRRQAEARRLEEEEKHKVELKRLQEEEDLNRQEEQERKRRFLEDEARRKEEEERRVAESQRLEEEQRKAEERKQQEEASMSDRLSSLFGMLRKKEEKKEEVQESPPPATIVDTKSHEEPNSPFFTNPFEDIPLGLDSKNLEQPTSHNSSNPFDEIPLGSDPVVGKNESPADHQKPGRTPQPPSAMGFLNRTAKVSAVKPRLTQSLVSEPPDIQTLSPPCPSPEATSDFTLSSVSSDSPATFSNLHSSLAPPSLSQSRSNSPFGSTESLASVESVESPGAMSEKRRTALLPNIYPPPGSHNNTMSEIKNPANAGAKQSVPLPDYETLFPQKRHGVQGETRWDHIIAEVNQKHRDTPPILLGPEMSVDAPAQHDRSPRSSVSLDGPATSNYQTHLQETKPVSSKKAAAHAPPKPFSSLRTQPPDVSTQWQNQNTAHQSALRPSPSVVQDPLYPDTSSRESLSGMSRDGERRATHSLPVATHVSRSTSQRNASLPENERKAPVSANQDAPTAKPRQKRDKEQQEDSTVTPDRYMHRRTSSGDSTRRTDKNVEQAKEDLSAFDPYFSNERRSKDPRTQQNKEDLFTGNMEKKYKPESRGMTAGDLDEIFSQDKPADPFAQGSENRTGADSKPISFYAFQRSNSQRQKQALASKANSDSKGPQTPQEPAHREETTKSGANQGLAARDFTKEPQADVITQNFYRGESQFGAETALSSSESLQMIMEEPAESLSAGKTPLQARVPPSDVQTVSAQNGTGGGLVLSARRPHPVKPLTSLESPHTNSNQSVKDMKVWDNTPGKIKTLADSGRSGPFSQLTQDELITLVVKQQTDLSKKDGKIVELEDYIDKLLLRVMEEKPSILATIKPV